jgi:hypothetical protein
LRGVPFPKYAHFPKVASPETNSPKESTMDTFNRFANDQRLRDAAKLRAEQLRREAIADFWSGSGEAARKAARSAQRFASSLARHAKLRGHQGA